MPRGKPLAPISMNKLQECIDYLESKNTYTNRSALYKAIAETAWGVERGLTVPIIYNRVKLSQETSKPIEMKTPFGKVRRGVSEEENKPIKEIPISPPKEIQLKHLRDDPEVEKLRRELDELKRKYFVYFIDDENHSMILNPECIRQVRANGYAWDDAPYEYAERDYQEFLLGLEAGQNLVKHYSEYARNHPLNSTDERRIKEVVNVLTAFSRSSPMSTLKLRSKA